MAENRDYDTLALAWKRWRDVAKGEMKQLYEEFVELSNEGVRGSSITFSYHFLLNHNTHL
jgi:hypothetical protein